ncbi:hypothetical protein WICPIJ_000776 [Wickerhamomyces pijperi]|uniref:Protein YOP1 n=1 Tax=Wickerhamomyces pijperi TaxID=599730 RepID=A0A9P8TS45_WICPI|nr:hypothetical protein WICPIJ_000776 [Wickerhamomyces pijperi]
MFSFITNTLSFVISYVYPAIGTFKALKQLQSSTNATSDNNNNNTRKGNCNSLKPWLVYWLMFSLLSFAESNLYFILQYIPFYIWVIKPYLCLWLILPQTQGSMVLYGKYFEPFMEKHLTDIEDLASVAGAVEGLTKLLKLAGIDIDRDDFILWKYIDRPTRTKTRAKTKAATTTQPVFGEQLLEDVLNATLRSGESEVGSEKKAKDVDMIKSFGGVLEYFVAKATNSSSSEPASVSTSTADTPKKLTEETRTGSDESLKGLTTRNSNSATSVNDFDMIGKEEVAFLKSTNVTNGEETETGRIEQTPKKAGWFSFSSWGSTGSSSSASGYSALKNSDIDE